jgi:transcriptional regulator with XRE-family HTH domain
VLISQARRAAGLSQAALAKRARTYQPAIAEIERGRRDPSGDLTAKILSSAGYRSVAVPTFRTPVAEAALWIHEALDAGDDRWAWRRLLQVAADLTGAEPALRVVLAFAPPPSTGDRRFDAGLAALVDWHLTTAGLPVPGWVNDPSRSVAANPWTVTDIEPFASEARASSPPPFAKRGVFVNIEEFAAA